MLCDTMRCDMIRHDAIPYDTITTRYDTQCCHMTAASRRALPGRAFSEGFSAAAAELAQYAAPLAVAVAVIQMITGRSVTVVATVVVTVVTVAVIVVTVVVISYCSCYSSARGAVGLQRFVARHGGLRTCQVPTCAVAAGGLTIHTQKWFLGAGFLGALPTSLRTGAELQTRPVPTVSSGVCKRRRKPLREPLRTHRRRSAASREYSEPLPTPLGTSTAGVSRIA